VRLLLDESLPRPFAGLLTGHEVRTVTQMGWTSLSNGALLRQAAAEFDALLTADQNIEFQQNLKAVVRQYSDIRANHVANTSRTKRRVGLSTTLTTVLPLS
jgi:hypothetical protein